MEFNKFVKKIRTTNEYDEIIEAKPKDLTSREFLALFYANDLYDNDYKLKQILKLFPKEYWSLVGETLRERIKPKGIKVAWTMLASWILIAETYNKKFGDYVGYKRYLDEYFPVPIVS
ncbi:MAG: hypothetical protein GY760_29245 [Deltaproteobacteria bacterium]|nr:hypothetical protein [Deltaproteobacteria bacterium]